jgi:uncharacterized membrane protein
MSESGHNIFNCCRMEKRIFGIILTVLGVAGLIIAAMKFMNGTEGSRGVKEIVIYGILGAIFFFSGIGLVKNTHDRAR